MRPALLLGTAAIAATTGILGSSEEGLWIEMLAVPACRIHWNGMPGRTYFMQESADLVGWLYDPHIKSGTGQPLSHDFLSPTAARLFFRLRVCAIPTANPATADFDLDGAGNQAELDAGTDPLDADSDDDGTPDGADPAPLDPSTGGNPLFAQDSDADGLFDSEELAAGTSPTLRDTDGDGYDDGIDEHPLDPARHQLAPADPADTTGPAITLESPANAVLL